VQYTGICLYISYEISEEAKESLAAAITLILEDRLQDALRGLPEDAIRDEVLIS